MMDVQEKKRQIQRILQETVITLCKNTLEFTSELSVEGLLGITMDKTDVLLVSMKDIVMKNRTIDSLGKDEQEKSDKSVGSIKSIILDENGTQTDNDDTDTTANKVSANQQNTAVDYRLKDSSKASNFAQRETLEITKNMPKEPDFNWQCQEIKIEQMDSSDQSECSLSDPITSVKCGNVKVEPVLSVSQSHCPVEYSALAHLQESSHTSEHVNEYNNPLPLQSMYGLSSHIPENQREQEETGRTSHPTINTSVEIKADSPEIDFRGTYSHFKTSSAEVPPMFTTGTPGRRPALAVSRINENSTNPALAYSNSASTKIMELKRDLVDSNEGNSDNTMSTEPILKRHKRVVVLSTHEIDAMGNNAFRVESGKFTCNICGQTFQHNASMHRHIRSHAGKYFPCPVCATPFSRRDSMRRHYKNSHPEQYAEEMAARSSEGIEMDSSFDVTLTMDETHSLEETINEHHTTCQTLLDKRNLNN